MNREDDGKWSWKKFLVVLLLHMLILIIPTVSFCRLDGLLQDLVILLFAVQVQASVWFLHKFVTKSFKYYKYSNLITVCVIATAMCYVFCRYSLSEFWRVGSVTLILASNLMIFGFERILYLEMCKYDRLNSKKRRK